MRERAEELLSGQPFGRLHSAIFALAALVILIFIIIVRGESKEPFEAIELLIYLPILFLLPLAVICIKEKNYRSKKSEWFLISQYTFFLNYLICILLIMALLAFNPDLDTCSWIVRIGLILIIPLLVFSIISLTIAMKVAIKRPRNEGWFILSILEILYLFLITGLFGMPLIKFVLASVGN
jgi:cytochrome bd-type quinol oxidase subunit 2